MCYSQVVRPVLRLEKMEKKSKVTPVPVKSNRDRILQSMIGGALIAGQNLGYDYKEDKDIPVDVEAVDLRGMDITEKVELFGYLTGKIKERMNGYYEEEQKKEDARKAQVEEMKQKEFEEMMEKTIDKKDKMN